HGKISLKECVAIQESYEPSTVKNFAKESKNLLSKRISEVRDRLRKLLFVVESAVEFDEVESPDLSHLLSTAENLRTSIDEMIIQSEENRRRLEGAKIVILGAPNVGKSSLFNAILGFDQAIVSPLAGTTRDIVQGYWDYKGFK